MSMQFNGSVHADGWLEHMPSGHTRNLAMNNGAVDRESNVPPKQRHHHRAQTAAWVLLFLVAAGGLSMAAARQLDPVGFDAKVDAVMASAHNLGDKIADQFDNKKPAVNMDVTALATPAEPAAPPAATASVPQSQSQSQSQAQPQAQPQQLIQQQPTGAGTVQPLEANKPVPQPETQSAVSKSTLAPPTPAAALPMQVQPATQIQPVTPIAPITPVTPIQPGTQSPPIPPATQAPPVTQTPPPPPPTQGPQAEQSSL
ncbi:hypothetical protein ACFJGW_19730 [Burkholderiaceae bacterium UC74_6]